MASWLMRNVFNWIDDSKDEWMDQALTYSADVYNIKNLPMVNNFTLLTLIEIAHRARTGEALTEPYGSAVNFPGFDDLMFLPAQMADLPLNAGEVEVDTTVTIGPNCQRPLVLNTPIIISALNYGSVSLRTKETMARAATLAGTACNSGESGFMALERDLAENYIVQYNRGRFRNTTSELAAADMIEVWAGQGAAGTTGWTMDADDVGPDLAEHFQVDEDEDIVMPARHIDINEPGDWKRLVERLRGAVGGVPIGVKMGAGRLERDLPIAVEAGFDAITIDGGNGGTGKSEPVTIDSFNVPSLFGLPAADRILRELGVRDKVSLLAAGGFRDTSDVLKAMALGADAIYMAEAPLTAMVFSQYDKLPVGSNPDQLFVYGKDNTDQLDPKLGAEHVANFIKACTFELQDAVRSLGKRRVSEVDRRDLVALSPRAAAACEVPLAYQAGRQGYAYQLPNQNGKHADEAKQNGQVKSREKQPDPARV